MLTHRVWFSAILPIVIANCTDPEPAGRTAALELREVRAQQLPDSFPLRTAALGSDGRAIYVSQAQRFVLMDVRGAVSEIGAGLLREPVAAGFSADGGVEVFDGLTQSISRFDEHGRRVAEVVVTFPTAVEVEDAVLTQSGWVVGGTGPQWEYLIYSVDAAGNASEVYRVAPPDPATAPYSAFLQAAGNSVIASPLTASWPVTRVTIGTGSREDQFEMLTAQELEQVAGGIGSPGAWVPLAVIPLDRGAYLQTYSDLRSDARVLVLYDHAGVIHRKTPVRAPLGFVAGDPGARLLLAVRVLSGSEAVFYEWTWID